jgi:nitrogen fixation-related uncharacterized protein
MTEMKTALVVVAIVIGAVALVWLLVRFLTLD